MPIHTHTHVTRTATEADVWDGAEFTLGDILYMVERVDGSYSCPVRIDRCMVCDEKVESLADAAISRIWGDSRYGYQLDHSSCLSEG